MTALPDKNPLKSKSLELLYNLQAHLRLNQPTEVDEEDEVFFMALELIYQRELAAAVERGIERGRLEGRLEGVEEGVEQGIHRGQRLILENLLRVRFGDLDARMPVLIESIAALSPEQFALFLLPLSQVGNDEAGRQGLPRLFVEELLNFRWGEVEEGEDRESSVQSILALEIEPLSEILLRVKSESKDEVLAGFLESSR